jgi:hypothetical protein
MSNGYTTVTLASSNNALPDDGDCTETCRSCFNVSFNVNFKIVFKTIQLCISWRIKEASKKFEIWGFSEILSKKLKFRIKSDNNNGT